VEVALKEMANTIKNAQPSFSKLSKILEHGGTSFPSCTARQVSTALVALAKHMPSSAKAAYSGLALLDDYRQLKWDPALRKTKTTWGGGT
jgi:hypothetical protein